MSCTRSRSKVQRLQWGRGDPNSTQAYGRSVQKPNNREEEAVSEILAGPELGYLKMDLEVMWIQMVEKKSADGRHMAVVVSLGGSMGEEQESCRNHTGNSEKVRQSCRREENLFKVNLLYIELMAKKDFVVITDTQN